MKCIETSQGEHVLSCHASPFQPGGRQEQGVAEAQVFVLCWPVAQRVRSRVFCIPCTALVTPHH